ncbi:MAG: hypothetical protein COA78_08125 [Blastopirellula sp.]|nr:MAG: hypothetical protein COA78_08125 [Blastopirellula sp.]
MNRVVSFCLMALTVYCASFSTATVCHAADEPSSEQRLIGQYLKQIKSVGKEGKNHSEAIAAMRKLSQTDIEHLPQVLAGMKNASPLAVNWIRAAVETIAQNQADELSTATLLKFLNDTSKDAKARTVAYELIQGKDQELAEKQIPSFMNDPSLALRRLAVTQTLDEATQLEKDEKKSGAIKQFKLALNSARDEDQVNEAAKHLRDLGEEVDLPLQFGLITSWQLVAPFDFADGEGFNTVYAPENEIDLSASYQGKEIEELKGPASWKQIETEDEKAFVDFNEHFAAVKQVVGYAYTEFNSAEATPVEFRISSPNGLKVWLNGKLITEQEIYHSGTTFDQYISQAKLNQGKNSILVKIVQNAQTESWTNVWKFQLRICDSLGTAVLASDRVAAK